jgi:hypothetical protein
MDLPLEIIEGEYAVLQLHPRSWSRLKIQVNTGKVFVTESRLIRRYHVSPEAIQKLMADCRLTSNTISGAPGRNQLVFVQDSSVSSACWRLPNRSLHSIPMDARQHHDRSTSASTNLRPIRVVKGFAKPDKIA